MGQVFSVQYNGAFMQIIDVYCVSFDAVPAFSLMSWFVLYVYALQNK